MSNYTKTREGLAAARAAVAGLLDKPITDADLDGCAMTLDECIRAIELMPTFTAAEQREASRLVVKGLTEVRGAIKRRPKK